MARTRGTHTALAGGRAEWPGQVLSHAGLADVLECAAAGLVRRGLRAGDAVGVYVPDAASYVVAIHAILAAGGVPSPASACASAARVAEQLTQSGARILITASPLTDLALEAADGSRVRQVISFEDAPGTTPFSALLGKGRREAAGGRRSDPALVLYRQGVGGWFGCEAVSHAAMAGELARLAASSPLSASDVVLAAPPAGDCLDYTIVVNLALLCGGTVAAVPGDDMGGAAMKHCGTAAVAHPGMSVPSGLALRVVGTSR
ncbi:MAG TPA: AMP-binding protein [Streptosporangiaceae bacterium]|nr:AMP-binding protein [Streptosporangiaceae bacterium]